MVNFRGYDWRMLEVGMAVIGGCWGWKQRSKMYLVSIPHFASKYLQSLRPNIILFRMVLFKTMISYHCGDVVTRLNVIV